MRSFKLDKPAVKKLRRLRAKGITVAELARQFEVSTAAVKRYLKDTHEEARDKASRKLQKRESAKAQTSRKLQKRESEKANRDAKLRELWVSGWQGAALAKRFRLSVASVSLLVAGLTRDRQPASAPELAQVPVPVPSPTIAPIPRTAPLDPRDVCERSPHGRIGSAHSRAKVDELGVIEMRRLRKVEGWSTGRLAQRFGMSRNTVCYALSGRTWGHVPGAIPAKREAVCS